MSTSSSSNAARSTSPHPRRRTPRKSSQTSPVLRSVAQKENAESAEAREARRIANGPGISLTPEQHAALLTAARDGVVEAGMTWDELQSKVLYPVVSQLLALSFVHRSAASSTLERSTSPSLKGSTDKSLRGDEDDVRGTSSARISADVSTSLLPVHLSESEFLEENRFIMDHLEQMPTFPWTLQRLAELVLHPLAHTTREAAAQDAAVTSTTMWASDGALSSEWKRGMKHLRGEKLQTALRRVIVVPALMEDD